MQQPDHLFGDVALQPPCGEVIYLVQQQHGCTTEWMAQLCRGESLIGVHYTLCHAVLLQQLAQVGYRRHL
jgi:ABC-type hemin transport system substrate-binding protein